MGTKSEPVIRQVVPPPPPQPWWPLEVSLPADLGVTDVGYGGGQILPSPSGWRWKVQDITGSRVYVEDGRVYVRICIRRGRGEESVRHTIPVDFPSVDHAERAGRLLAEAFALTQEA